MKIGIKWISIILLAYSLGASASDSLCQPDEEDYFSCKTGSGQTVSLCGHFVARDGNSPDFTLVENPYLVYRFGAKDNIEMSYSSVAHGISAFHGQSAQSAGGSIDSVVFETGEKAYSIEYRTADVPEKSFVGLVVADPAIYGLRECKLPCVYQPTKQMACSDKPFFGSEGDEFFAVVRQLEDLKK